MLFLNVSRVREGFSDNNKITEAQSTGAVEYTDCIFADG